MDSCFLEAWPAVRTSQRSEIKLTQKENRWLREVGLQDVEYLTQVLLLSGPVPSAPCRTTHILLFIIS